MSIAGSTLSTCRVRDFACARFAWRNSQCCLFFAVVMGLPLLFLLAGSFNLAPPGQAAFMVLTIGCAPLPIRDARARCG